jgi:phosphoribosyl-AMP cyclohydrolase
LKSFDDVKFNEKGLVPVVTQSTDGTVLMLAWMNLDTIKQTLATGVMTYWSRSRNQVWVKGETSGNKQQLSSLRLDCDGDSLLAIVESQGPACHEGTTSCFANEFSPKIGD